MRHSNILRDLHYCCDLCLADCNRSEHRRLQRDQAHPDGEPPTGLHLGPEPAQRAQRVQPVRVPLLREGARRHRLQVRRPARRVLRQRAPQMPGTSVRQSSNGPALAFTLSNIFAEVRTTRRTFQQFSEKLLRNRRLAMVRSYLRA
jgi:hypothetical protein